MRTLVYVEVTTVRAVSYLSAGSSPSFPCFLLQLPIEPFARLESLWTTHTKIVFFLFFSIKSTTMASLNDLVPSGVVTGDDLLTLLEHARANSYAIPAVNCTRYVTTCSLFELQFQEPPSPFKGRPLH